MQFLQSLIQCFVRGLKDRAAETGATAWNISLSAPAAPRGGPPPGRRHWPCGSQNSQGNPHLGFCSAAGSLVLVRSKAQVSMFNSGSPHVLTYTGWATSPCAAYWYCKTLVGFQSHQRPAATSLLTSETLKLLSELRWAHAWTQFNRVSKVCTVLARI